jgi:hypothetical protein
MASIIRRATLQRNGYAFLLEEVSLSLRPLSLRKHQQQARLVRRSSEEQRTKKVFE